jgi:NADH-quinone oxidoreductase subunit J
MTEAWLFYPMAIVALGGALGMILARNPVHGAMSLVLSFFGIASVYVLLAAELIAALQIIVYAGAIMVLFVFVIMLLNLNEEDLERPRLTPGSIVGGAAALAFWMISFMIFSDLPEQAMPTELPEGFGQVASVGRLIFGSFILPFESTSVLLLVAMVGAIVVAKARI